MNEEQFYQKIKNSIKEKKLWIAADSFHPVMKIVLELPLEPANDASIGKQKIYELIGMAILEAQVETLGPPTGKIFDLSKKYNTPQTPNNMTEPTSLLLNPETTPEFLAIMSTNEEWMTRALVAKHLNTSPETLSYLSKDKERYVVSKVVQNPNTTSVILEEILNRDDVRFIFKEDIFNHPNVTPEIYLKYFS